ncbi:formyltetrahydrofolate deformylase [Candidatus Tokpelaia sp.]|uniref:formyltetrahydrofolate deformylase n=1 Tax=Candidatus Tokpelaia sp. TaxID=2233777 RepID=UPI00123A046C|nr:formyltetrahydrofolate deformylase [Candidatus Tokpelaia sp.]KAA6404702.1 formyltetrahydrofolate deformylase [Candidatus Tokpelaia sp.]
MNNLILSVSCRGQKGIVAAVSSCLAKNNCNITELSQFDNLETGRFFMRINFIDEQNKGPQKLNSDFKEIKQNFAMKVEFHEKAQKMKLVLMVSKFSHCLYDLLYRRQIGALPVTIAAIISNHNDYADLAALHAVPFHYIPVTDNKTEAENRLKAVIAETGAELIVLARYMQVLSADLCAAMAGRIINIHHSFLPGFKGANPYRQAWRRGVKLIGATAHYVTAALDEGPIIEQDVIRVSHAQSAEDFVAIGRDVEAQVLARAVLAHSQHRIFIDDNRVIVFPAGPGDFTAAG